MGRVMVAVIVGVLAGAASGLLGIGGGMIFVPLAVLWLGFTQHRAHATSLAAIAPIAVVGALGFALAGEVDLAAAVGLSAGALIGAPVGARVMAGLSERRLKIAFGIFLVIVGAAMVL